LELENICFNCDYWEKRILNIDTGEDIGSNNIGICMRIGHVIDRRDAEISIISSGQDKKAIMASINGKSFDRASFITSANFGCVLFNGFNKNQNLSLKLFSSF